MSATTDTMLGTETTIPLSTVDSAAPVTEAGKRLADWLTWAAKRLNGVPAVWQVTDIEAEAAAAAKTRKARTP